jgi:hypothetical protein
MHLLLMFGGLLNELYHLVQTQVLCEMFLVILLQQGLQHHGFEES